MKPEEYTELAQLRQLLARYVKHTGNNKVMARDIPSYYNSSNPSRIVYPDIGIDVSNYWKHQFLIPMQNLREAIANKRDTHAPKKFLTLHERERARVEELLKKVLDEARPSISNNFNLEFHEFSRTLHTKGKATAIIRVSAGWRQSVWRGCYAKADKTLLDHIILSSTLVGTISSDLYVRRVKLVTIKNDTSSYKDTYFGVSLRYMNIWAFEDTILKLRNKLEAKVAEAVKAEMKKHAGSDDL